MTAKPRKADTLDALRVALRADSWSEYDARVIDSGACFGDGQPVELSIRKRGRRYDLDDRGVAIAKAGRPRGWLDVARRVVAREGFNVNRAGVIFVPVVEGRDLASIASRLADNALEVYGELLELSDER